MNIFVYRSKFIIQGTGQDNFDVKIIENIEVKLRTVFSKFYVGNNKIVFENGIFSFFMVFNFFEIISNGVIKLEKSKRLIALSYEVSFARYVAFWFVFSAIMFLCLIFTEVLLLAIIVPILWISLTFLFTQISLYRLNSKIIDGVREVGGEIIN